MTSGGNELGAFLRARRASRSPQAAGLPGGGRRRAAGLRREELAALAGVSVDYLVRLEQGRQREPSAEVLRALSTGLGLTADARRHLFALAGRTDPQPVDPATATVPAPLRRLLDGAHPAPAWILNRRADIVAWNPAADELLGGLDPGRNYLHLVFGPSGDLWADRALVAQDAVAHLRAVTAGILDHPTITSLIRELSDTPEFARLWARRDVRAACSPARDARHPTAGPLQFDVQLLDTEGGDLRLVVLEPRTDATRTRWAEHLNTEARTGQRLRIV